MNKIEDIKKEISSLKYKCNRLLELIEEDTDEKKEIKRLLRDLDTKMAMVLYIENIKMPTRITAAAIARFFNVSRESVRQTIGKSMSKIKKYMYTTNFKEKYDCTY